MDFFALFFSSLVFAFVDFDLYNNNLYFLDWYFFIAIYIYDKLSTYMEGLNNVYSLENYQHIHCSPSFFYPNTFF